MRKIITAIFLATPLCGCAGMYTETYEGKIKCASYSVQCMDDIGTFYEYGKGGVAKDYGKALEWYMKSVDHNESINDPGKKSSYAATHRAFFVGDWIWNGVGTTDSPEVRTAAAARYWEIGARNGDYRSIIYLAGLHYTGTNPPVINKDIPKAVSYTHLTLPTIYSV